MRELVGYPEGTITEVTQKEFEELNELDLVRFDDEWTEDTPNGQWGYMNDDTERIEELLGREL